MLTSREFRCVAAPSGRPHTLPASAIHRRAARNAQQQCRRRNKPVPRAAADTTTDATPTAGGKTCIFQALGGAAAVEAAVDRFYERVLADPEVAHYFEGVDMKKQKSKQMAFMALAFGGPDSYRGRDMRTAHQGLPGLANRHFDAIVGQFVGTLQDLGVQQDVIDKAAAVVESTRAQFDLAEN